MTTTIPLGVTRRRISLVHRMAVADARHDVARGIRALAELPVIGQSADGEAGYAVYSQVMDAAFRKAPVVTPTDAISLFTRGDQDTTDWLEQNVYADVHMDESALLVEALCGGAVRPWGIA